MDFCLVLSLQHLCNIKVIALLLSKQLPFIKDSLRERSNHLKQKVLRDNEYEVIKSQVSKDIANLILPSTLQEKLKNFIAPLFREIRDWLKICERTYILSVDTLFVLMENIPQCWLAYGTLDREKSAYALVRNGDVYLKDRFVLACMFCFYDDIRNMGSAFGSDVAKQQMML